jgi:hypothetical protein
MGRGVPAPFASHVKVVQPEEQEQASCPAWRPGGLSTMDVRERPIREDRAKPSIRVNDLSEVVMGGNCLWQAKQRLIPLEALDDVRYANNGPGAFQGIELVRA